jgi:acyl dehydratase
MPLVYFEDLEVGATFTSGEIAANREEMLAYNRRNDPWPFHVDEAAATKTPFGGIIASGGYTITLMYRLGHQIYNVPGRAWAVTGAVDWQLKFPTPLRPDDRVRLRLTIQGKRESSRPERGIFQPLYEVLNQKDEVVLSVLVTGFIARRPAG